ncbi:Transcriptional regulatory protein sin3, partial [Nowakowskiella sp. JEL0078]
MALLEPLARKIQDMTPGEKLKFKLGPTLGGSSAAIYKRVIKKIYDKTRGEEIIELLQSNPAIAVPVVLKRLKQKDEEWKKCQREWNKVWRDVDLKNHFKALDHQGIIFKQNDRKAITIKSLQNEIDTLYQEQRNTRGPSDALSKPQMEFTFSDPSVFKDLQRLLFCMLDFMNLEDDAVIRFMKIFLPRFFWVDLSEIGPDFEDEDHENFDGLHKLSGGGTFEFDIPKKANGRVTLLKNAQTENVSTSFGADETDTSINNSNSMLYQMAYSRLLKMKQISKELANFPPPAETLNPVAVELGFQKNEYADESLTTRNRYDALLNLLQDFFESKIEAPEFEEKARIMFSTSAYITFTMDKLIQAIIKQIHTIVADENRERTIKLYYRDRSKGTSTARQEAAYRIEAENLALDEQLFRMEFITTSKVLTIQAIGKEESATDNTISKEEKWSIYVDHFVQIYSSEGPRLKRREPFLRRNFPRKVVVESPGNVQTRSGLELKICVNTYKIFFVENTEDFFRRKYPQHIIENKEAKVAPSTLSIDDALTEAMIKDRRIENIVSKKHFEIFRKWWESESTGWCHGLSKEDVSLKEASIYTWLTNGQYQNKQIDTAEAISIEGSVESSLDKMDVD